MKTSDLMLVGAVLAVALVAVSAIKKAHASPMNVGGSPDDAYTQYQPFILGGAAIYDTRAPSVANPAPGTAQAYSLLSLQY